MIGHIEGRVLRKEDRALLITTGGIGYVVFVTPSTALACKLGSEMSLFTHLSVKENALELYGFLLQEELATFRLLIGISGIGPKSAQNILALADHKTLARAIRRGDSAYLTKVSGIGKKLSEKIVLELKDRIGDSEGGDEVSRVESEALLALEALGYAARDTRAIVQSIAKNAEHPTAQLIIRRALQELGRN